MKQRIGARATGVTGGPRGEGSSHVLDPQLVGEWMEGRGERLVLRADATFYAGTVNVPYWLQATGQELNINHRSTYTRMPGSDPTSLVGRWRDGAQGEELDYRHDGRFVDMFDRDPLVYFGVFLFDPAKVSSWEYRGIWSTHLGQITLDSIFGVAETATYTIDGDDLVLVWTGGATTYRPASAPRMPPPATCTGTGAE